MSAARPATIVYYFRAGEITSHIPKAILSSCMYDESEAVLNPVEITLVLLQKATIAIPSQVIKLDPCLWLKTFLVSPR
jgi:hypothetical protein